MLDNLPPPGTPVVFIRQTKRSQPNDTATLVRPKFTYPTDSPGDIFIVRLPDGEEVEVTRADIKRG